MQHWHLHVNSTSAANKSRTRFTLDSHLDRLYHRPSSSNCSRRRPPRATVHTCASMDDPANEIAGVSTYLDSSKLHLPTTCPLTARVVHQLTQTPPSVQRDTILKYFTNDAAFIHPFCRTGSFDGSRFLIQGIYRWYKIMSPRIKLSVNSVGMSASAVAAGGASSG